MKTTELDKFVEYGELLCIYGKLLSEDCQKICESYFLFNNTLMEIAAERGITRQAVSDAIQRGCRRLEELENLLQISCKKKKLASELFSILQQQPKLKEKVEKILEEF